MSLLPISSVTLAVPFRTISTTVLNAFEESRSVGEIKFPAALLTISVGRPISFSTLSIADFTASGSRISAEQAKILLPVLVCNSLAASSRTCCRLKTRKKNRIYDYESGIQNP